MHRNRLVLDKFKLFVALFATSFKDFTLSTKHRIVIHAIDKLLVTFNQCCNTRVKARTRVRTGVRDLDSSRHNVNYHTGRRHPEAQPKRPANVGLMICSFYFKSFIAFLTNRKQPECLRAVMETWMTSYQLEKCQVETWA